MPRIRVDSSVSEPKTATVAGEGKSGDTVKPVAGEEMVRPIDEEIKAKSSGSMLSAFEAYPRGILFGSAEEGEKLILLLRAHFITNFVWLAVSFLLLFVPVILVPLISALGLFNGVGVGIVFVATVFWYAGVFTYAFINFLYWYFNVYIVTDERVVDVDWYSVIVRKVSSTEIEHVQDASAIQVGVLQGIFDFGNVQIQTAGTEENFEFEYVPHPQLVAKKLEELMLDESNERERGGNL